MSLRRRVEEYGFVDVATITTVPLFFIEFIDVYVIQYGSFVRLVVFFIHAEQFEIVRLDRVTYRFMNVTICVY